MGEGYRVPSRNCVAISSKDADNGSTTVECYEADFRPTLRYDPNLLVRGKCTSTRCSLDWFPHPDTRRRALRP
jgi:hypothetical protein